MSPAQGEALAGEQRPVAGPRHSPPPLPAIADPAGFERLRALVQRGYAVDLDRAGPGGGLLLNHSGGPALLLMPDGTVESLQRSRAGEPRAQTIGVGTEADRRLFANFLERLAPGRAKPRRWRKRLFVTVLILAVWGLSILLSVAFTSM